MFDTEEYEDDTLDEQRIDESLQEDESRFEIVKITGTDRELALEKLDKIGLILSETRSEAISGREDSGIEKEWLEDEEFYEGIDDANRGETSAWRGKPLGQPSAIDADNESKGSTIFVNITRSYVDATSARVSDVLLPSDKKSFSIKHTPIPELIKLSSGELSNDKRQEIILKNPADPAAQDQETQETIDSALEEIEIAKESAKKAETQIWDWQVECQFNSQGRRLIEDAAKVGSGILKGPIPSIKYKTVFKDGKVQRLSSIKPISLRVFYRNFYPDPACGENIHNGNYTWERDDITTASLIKLKGTPGYIEEQINKCVMEGPQEASKEFRAEDEFPGLRAGSAAQRKMFEIWYYYGTIRKSELINIDILSKKDDIEDYENDLLNVQLTMVNNRVIKGTLSHIQTGEFPYDMMIWQRRTGMPWGIGVARQVRPPQRIVNGAVRHMMNNAGIAGGPMMFIDTTVIRAIDGVNEIAPWKVFVAAEEYEKSGGDKTHVRDAIQFLTAPMMQGELQAIMDMGMRLAEDVTGLPQIMQGQANDRTPETLGGMQLQNRNGNVMIKRVARLYDDLVTKPHIIRYYDYILEYSEDESLKGDMTIDAIGSSTLAEQDAADQSMLDIGQFVLNPVFGKDPKKWMDELLHTRSLDPKRIEYDDEEWKGIVEQMSQPQADPRAEIEAQKIQANQQATQFKIQADQQMAQFKAQVDTEALTLKLQSDQQMMQFKAKVDQQLEQMKSLSGERKLQQTKEYDAQDKAQERQLKSEMLKYSKELDVQVKQLIEAGNDKRNMQIIQQKLQDTVMKLKTQIQLSGTVAVDPIVEPAGRAPDGQSFTK